MSLSAVIVAAGSSTRFGFDKLFAELGGKSVVQQTIEQFVAAKCIEQIVIVTRAENVSRMRELIAAADWPKMSEVLVGGERRQDSVAIGLKFITSKFVAVHDAARALITPAEIGRTFAAASAHGAATLVAPVTDTLKRADRDLFVAESVERENLFAMQTPQIFQTELLRSAYANLAGKTITDEVSAVQAAGGRVQLVVAQEQNLKITFPPDLETAEMILAARARSV